MIQVEERWQGDNEHKYTFSVSWECSFSKSKYNKILTGYLNLGIVLIIWISINIMVSCIYFEVSFIDYHSALNKLQIWVLTLII